MKKFALIGHPLGHSLSPEIHSAIMAQAGIDGSYGLLDIPPEDIPARMPALLREYDGFNATIPHKKAVIPFLSGLSDAAKRCGAVNTVCGGRGYNTDAAGFRSAGMPLEGARVVLVGTGGVASMMAAESVAAGAAALCVAPQTRELGEDFISGLREKFPESHCEFSLAATEEDKGAAVAAATVLLNGSPIGMWPKAGGIPVDPAALHAGLSVFDPVYCPTPSRLVLNARKAGARAVGGLKMLVCQAVEAQKIWNPGLSLDSEAIAEKLLPPLSADLWRKNPTKIVLTGFMGAGKSTVGKILADSLGIGFTDLDAEIVRDAGVTIPEIFAGKGEAGFREIETAVAGKILAESRSAVVASGGGFPVRDENRALVRASNALVVHIDGDFETLWARIATAGGRPLGKERDSAAASYAARDPVYRAFCDAAVRTSAAATPSSVAGQIAALLRA